MPVPFPPLRRVHLRRLASLLACAAAAPLPLAAQAPASGAGAAPAADPVATRGVTSDDYFAFKLVSDPQVSPDGRQVAYVVARVDRAQNRRMSSIWLAPVDGGAAPRRLTSDALSSSAPQWSPDGQAIAFLSARPTGGDSASARPQLWVLSLRGGEPRRVTSLRNGVNDCSWAPDGARFACVSRTGPTDRRAKARESDVRHYTYAAYKFNGAGWFDDRRGHVWVIDANTGAARQVTEGDAWNDSDPQWSPDGTRLAFVSNRSGKESEFDRNSDVWVIPATGGAPVRISDHPAQDGSPRWSPDGRTIAFVGAAKENERPRIWLVPSAGGAPSRALGGEAFDFLPQGLTWAEGGRALYFGSGVRGETQLFRLDAGNGAVRALTSGPRAARGVSLSERGDVMAYTANDFTHLDEVYVARANGQGERRISSANDSLLSRLALQPVERFSYKAVDGLDIDGFVVKPLGWKPGTKYPVILNIHGGPAGMYGVDWFHEFQVYAAKGWGVLYLNPRGSTGYGHAFQRAIAGEWGGKDYDDVMRGVDVALARYDWMDSTRLGVTGGSYGGYLTNWIVTKTNRFKAAVTLRSISNFISDEGTRDGAYGHDDDFGGDLFQRFDFYWERSPLKYVQNVRTPILILHSENDFRVPLEQAEQWFRALRRYDRPSELVIFPRDNHDLTRTGEPKHLVESLDWQVYWFERYIDGKGSAVRPVDR